MPAEFAGEIEHLMEKNAIIFWTHVQNVKKALQLRSPLAGEFPTMNLKIEAWKSRLRKAGFKKVKILRYRYEITHEEWLAHISLPAILNSMVPQKEYRDIFIAELARRIEPSLRSERRWLIFIAS
jgi:hypothetical protein